MMGILSLPPEIFHGILSLLDPKDLGNLPRVCKGFRDFVEENNPLCRDVYCRILVSELVLGKRGMVADMRDRTNQPRRRVLISFRK